MWKPPERIKHPLPEARWPTLALARAQAEQSEAGLRTAARARLLADLADPQSVRRAFVLREVLGPPVGLR